MQSATRSSDISSSICGKAKLKTAVSNKTNIPGGFCLICEGKQPLEKKNKPCKKVLEEQRLNLPQGGVPAREHLPWLGIIES